MPAIPHRLEAAGGTDISYWHPMDGEIPQARPEGTVPQAQDGPPEPQHVDPPINIFSTPDMVHTMMRNTAEEPGVGGAGWCDPSTAARACLLEHGLGHDTQGGG